MKQLMNLIQVLNAHVSVATKKANPMMATFLRSRSRFRTTISDTLRD